MVKVRGTLSTGKAFKFDATAHTLADAVTELNAKLAAASVDPNTITSARFAMPRSAPQGEVAFNDVKKRERKAGSGKSGKR